MKPFIAGNWKMNKTIEESLALLKELKELIKDVTDKDILICPPFTALEAISREIEGSNIKLGAQNMYFEDEGAFTGEISPLMLKDLNCEYVILGHSERRQIFNESNELINRKIKAALDNGLKPILCVGETLEEREANNTINVIQDQIINCLKDIKDIEKITIAYEPVWAIGTGRTAKPEDAEAVHRFIRELIKKQFNKDTRILYGGSVKPDNIKALMQMENIDGALVGGASLKAKSFAEIVEF